ncbi:MAG: hypothetical protein V1847_03190 [Candidatus Diapherotrites archaeon]
MFAFTLSKLNLLVLVVAVFTIIAFFNSSMSESLKVKELNDLVNNQSIIISSMLSSPSYCDSLQRFIPESISLSGSELSYIMRVKVSEVTVDGERKSVVIFSAAERKSEKKSAQQILASASFGIASDTEVFLYSNDEDVCGSGSYCEVDSKELVFDPQAAKPTNSFWVVKEQELGKKNLYIIQCTFTSGITSACNAAKTEVGEQLVHPQVGTNVGGFHC